MMQWGIGLILVVILSALAAFFLRGRKSKDEPDWPFYAKKLLTRPEQVLYFRLVSALPEHVVLAQVQLSRLVGVKKGANAQSWLNRISRMSADYVICTKDSSAIAVVELDDASHQSGKRIAADAKKDGALKAAGINVFRWFVSELPDEAAIRATLLPKASV